MDIFTLVGIVVAVGMILLGQAMEGGHASSLMQLTAFLIVFGGTLGAVMVAFPKADFLRGLKLAKEAFGDKKRDVPGQMALLVELAGVARRDGVLALEGRIGQVPDEFLQKGLRLVVDGVDTDLVYDTLDAEIEHEFETNVAGAKVFESAGGFAPTVGILGAVLGLIHVMENLSDPSKLGPGIAVAFVATVYGVGMSNLLFLPMAAKIKRKVTVEKERKTMAMQGVLGIQAGLNPRILEEKLKALSGLSHAPAAAAGK